MKNLRNVFLVGPMGAGKTTIGRALAEQLDRPFCDSDREIEASTGADIPWIFDVEGEAGFRDREQKMIDTLSRRDGIVLATGGGAVMAKENRDCLRQRGIVVFLRATVQQQIERTSRDKNRPLLQTDRPERVIRQLMTEREPLYSEVADIVVDTNRRNAKLVCQDICRALESFTEAHAAPREPGPSGPESGDSKEFG